MLRREKEIERCLSEGLESLRNSVDDLGLHERHPRPRACLLPSQCFLMNCSDEGQQYEVYQLKGGIGELA